MRLLFAFAFLIAACSQTPLEFYDDEGSSVEGTWVSEWTAADVVDGVQLSTRYVLEISEKAGGTCTAMLSCECSSPDHEPDHPGTRYWEGSRQDNILSMQSTNLVTGTKASLTARYLAQKLNVTFSWGESATFTKTAD